MRRVLFIFACLVLPAALCQHSALAKATKPTIVLPAGWPKTLVISKIGVKATVESLALTRPQDAGAPYRWGDVAWFDRGARPGDLGRSVMFGHLDSTCCPAVFYHLRDLKAGDEVDVQYKKGTVRFKVMWQQVYPNAHTPWGWIYSQLPERGLSLITCTGVFHRDTGYDHVLVVYSRMVLPSGKLA